MPAAPLTSRTTRTSWALVAIGLANCAVGRRRQWLLGQVAKAQKDDGHLDAAETASPARAAATCRSRRRAGPARLMKTNAGVYDTAIRKAVKWVGQQRGGYGGFGSTQSTILALKALIAYTNANKRTPEAGELRLFVGDEKVAELAFPAGVDKPLTLAIADVEKKLKAGDNTVRVEITGAKNVFPHTLGWSYRTTKPTTAAGTPVELTATLARTSLLEGESVRLNVKVRNVSGKDQGMTVAILGPALAGLILPEDLKQLKEYTGCPTTAAGRWPLRSRSRCTRAGVVPRVSAKDATVELPVDLIARVPGVYRGPASRAYLYYNADHKHWLDPLAVTIGARE
ncbi:MAG: hypothetical protein U0736_06280 [Gemmataceae bacterium]